MGSAVPSSPMPPPHMVQQRLVLPIDYPVIFTQGVFAPDNGALAWTLGRLEPESCHRALVVVDEGVATGHPSLFERMDAYAFRHSQRLRWIANPLVVPGGEGIKQGTTWLERIVEHLHRHRVDRHCFVVGIGGGAVLDAVGFAAATVHRGVRLIRIPTTVLAQNDAGVGVKNGINEFGTKNFRGTFCAPWAVIDDFDLLSSLSDRDRIAGLAEAVKVALIRDREFFDWLRDHATRLNRGDAPVTQEAIVRCAQLHLRHIADGGDPFEKGNSRPLDFGHWAAHKLEQLTHHELRHGEAVAIGMALDTRVSVSMGHLPESVADAIIGTILRLGLPIWHDTLMLRADDGRLQVCAGIEEFREHLGGRLTVTLLAELGRGIDVHEMPERYIAAAIEYLHSRGA